MICPAPCEPETFADVGHAIIRCSSTRELRMQDPLGGACQQLLAEMESRNPPGLLAANCNGPIPSILADLAANLNDEQPVLAHATPWHPEDWRSGILNN